MPNLHRVRTRYLVSLFSIVALIVFQVLVAISNDDPYFLLEAATAILTLGVLVYSSLYVFRPVQNHIRQQQDAMLEERRRYTALFNQSNDAVFYLNLNGQHEFVNERAAQMFGYTLDEMLKLTRSEIIVPEQHAAAMKSLDQLLDGESLPLYERRVIHRDGHIFPVELNVSLVRQPDGTPQYILSIMRDITERKRLEQQTLELTLEREKLRLMAEFGHATSHDLRTPLSVINVNVHLMTRTDDPERRAERAKRIEEEVAKLNTMIDDLQLMSRLEAGMPYDVEIVDLNQTVHTALKRLSDLYESRGHQQVLNLSADAVFVSGARDYLTACTVALLENAALYTPPGGQVTITTELCDQCARLRVSDTGVGIASDEIDTVFDPFYKANKARTPDQSRAGLGLTLVKKIITLHNGSIAVQSEVGVGSTFTVTLPRDSIMA